MNPKKHIEEIVKELKKYISYVYSTHSREPSPHLDAAEGEKCLHDLVDLLPQAKSLEEALFYTNLLIDTLKSFTSHQIDFLDITKTQTALLTTVEDFTQKPTKTPEDFTQLKSSIEKIKNDFITKALDYIAELKEHCPPSYRLAIIKVNKLIEQMNAIAITLYILPTEQSADSTKKLINELVEEMQKITQIAHTDAGDFALEDQVVPPGTPSKTLSDSLNMILKLAQSQLSLKPLNSGKEELQTVIGLLFAISGSVSGLNATASKIVSAIDTLLTTGYAIKDGKESSSVTSFIKENPFDIMMLGVSIASLVTTAVTCPPALPIVLQTMGLLEISKNGIKIGQKIQGTKNVDKAVETADTFRQALRKDQIFRVSESTISVEQKTELKSKIATTDDSKTLAKYQQKFAKSQRAQLAVLTQDLSSGQSNHPVNQEIRHLVKIARGGEAMHEQLLLDGDPKATNLVVAAICKKFNGNTTSLRQFWEKLISLPPTAQIDALSKALGDQVKSKYIARFTQNLSSSLAARPNPFLPIIDDFAKKLSGLKTIEEITQLAKAAKHDLVKPDPHDSQRYQQCQQASDEINRLLQNHPLQKAKTKLSFSGVTATKQGLFSSTPTAPATTARLRLSPV